MAFKMKGFQAHDNSPMKVGGQWSSWAADNKAFVDKEIQDRRKAKGGSTVSKGDKKEKDTKTNKTTTENKPVESNTAVEKKGRVEHAFDNPNLEKYVKQEKGTTEGGVYKPGEKSISKYKDAWNDGRFKVSDDKKTKTDEFGNSYANTPEGFSQFEAASEKWWKGEQAKKDKGLNIDSQTNKQSTHEVWNENNKKEKKKKKKDNKENPLVNTNTVTTDVVQTSGGGINTRTNTPTSYGYGKW